jgi:hypothetical protein
MESRKEALHRLIDRLPEAEAEQVFRFLVSLLDEGVSLEDAPVDDEPVTEAEEEAARLSREEAASEGTISLAALKARHGL